MKHEGAEGITNKDGRYVIYLGDDERFDYVYKFVTEGRFDPQNRAANRISSIAARCTSRSTTRTEPAGGCR